MVTDGDVINIIERRVVADPAIIADDQFPGIGDADARPDQNVAANLGSE
jgi:hypothetical protein